MKGAGLNGHLELPKPSRELIGVKSHDELQTLLLVRPKLLHPELWGNEPNQVFCTVP